MGIPSGWGWNCEGIVLLDRGASRRTIDALEFLRGEVRGVKIVVVEGEGLDRNQPIRSGDRIPKARYPVLARAKPTGPDPDKSQSFAGK